MTKPNKPANTRRPADRTVFEVVAGNSRPRQVEARTAAELATGLKTHLKLDDLTARSAAHLLHAGATITGPSWSARPLGTFVFQPISTAPTGAPARSAVPTVQSSTDVPAEPLHVDDIQA